MKRKVIIIVLCLFVIIASSIYAYNNFYNPTPEFTLTVESDSFESNTSKNNILEPGSKIVSNLKVENTRNKDVSYFIYLDKLDGDLKDKLIFNIYNEDKLVFSCLAIKFNEENAFIPPVLKAGGIHSFFIEIEIYDHKNINQYQGMSLYFDIRLSKSK